MWVWVQLWQSAELSSVSQGQGVVLSLWQDVVVPQDRVWLRFRAAALSHAHAWLHANISDWVFVKSNQEVALLQVKFVLGSVLLWVRTRLPLLPPCRTTTQQ